MSSVKREDPPAAEGPPDAKKPKGDGDGGGGGGGGGGGSGRGSPQGGGGQGGGTTAKEQRVQRAQRAQLGHEGGHVLGLDEQPEQPHLVEGQDG